MAKKSRKLIITGDANLDSSKWNDEKFLYKSIASPLRNCLEQNGIKNDDSIGNTYLADHVLQNGTMPESALDHVYYSEDMKENINCASIKNSATDHLPVIITCYVINKV